MGAISASPATDTKTTIDAAEIEHFARLAAEWWNPNGKFRPLHKFNPVRLAYIRDKICRAFDRDPNSAKPLANISLVDIGCGGGLLCEPLARLGANVTGIDAAAANIKIARAHAGQSSLAIDYRADTAENLAAKGEKFDVVLAMEVVEHVANVPLFMQSAAALLQPQGLVFVATLNRTLKALALAIIGAEYILRWLPKGTHDYHKFLRPAELTKLLEQNGLKVMDEAGVTYNPLADKWALSRDKAVNYMLLARRQ